MKIDWKSEPSAHDAERPLGQREVDATLSECAERTNLDGQKVLDDLFSKREEMGNRAEHQLEDLFAHTKDSYGRARAVGMTAAEASKVVNRAFKR
jgi:hypothetical protein